MYDILIACLIAVIVTAIIASTVTYLLVRGQINKKLSGNLIVSKSEGVYLEMNDDSFVKDTSCHFLLLEIIRTQ